MSELLAERAPDLVAVDSPYRPAPDGALSREGERLLARRVCNIRFTPDEATLRANARYYEWIQHGFELYALLEAAGLEVIECFPTASWTRFGGRRGSDSRAAWTARSLTRMGIARLPARMSQDSRDAVAAALTARAATQGAIEYFGDIVVPIVLAAENASPTLGPPKRSTVPARANEAQLTFPLEEAPSTDHLVPQVAPVGTVLYHYTKSARAIRGILPDMKLRMSPFTAMGDPREFKNWSPYVTSSASEHAFMESETRLNALKQHFKLLALTMDDQTEPTDWGRGYARPRMWQYFAKGGTGVCLVLDREEFVDAVSAQLDRVGRFAHGPVKYENRFMRDEITLDLTRDADVVVNEIVDSHLAALFFIKTTDWASEHEYRFVVESETQPYVEVDIAGLLRAVILGPDVSGDDEAALRQLVLNLRAKGETTRFGVLAWWNSYPLHTGLSID